MDALTRIGQSLIGVLPPAFLVLVAILGIVFWHEAQQDQLRTELIARLIDRCIEPRARQGALDEPKHLPHVP